MSTEPFIGEVKVFGFNFPPLGYSLCQGQTLSIASYSALFALIGTTYGGNGQTTFKLPDLQGRVPIGQGQGPGLPYYSMGEAGGHGTITLTSANLPAHIHTMMSTHIKIKTNAQIADSGTALSSYPGTSGTNVWSESASANSFMAADAGVISGTSDITGSNYPFNIMNPYLVMNYSIAIYGIFPSRN